MALELLQVMSDQGTVDQKADPSIPKEDLLKLYRVMVLNRQVDERMLTLQRQGRIGFYLQSIGEEAATVGSAYALRREDWIFPCYREPGAAFYRGFPLLKFVCQLMGNAGDPVKGRQMPNHYVARDINYTSVSSPVGTQIPQAVGAAWAAKIKKDPIVVLVYFGEGATSEGDFHVGANFAGVFKAPAILFCRNNGYAISVPITRQTASESVAIKAKAYGFPGVRVDGNDILAVIKATQQAAARARNGEGPTLIEAVTYRRGPHSSSDDPRMYRSEDEVEQFARLDPINRFRRYLEERKLWDASQEQTLQEQTKEEILRTIQQAESFGPPPIDTLFEDVFVKLPPHLQEQKAYLQDYLSRNPRTPEGK
ncbi:MAG TPA: pyruvate dehydrogenase (acetyl-transferring) E1 component subunit alpha [Acidobacteriota bacterium]|nr:pyruvate dehydrogenase (acetyl-transferring) E1 component subunit alpha [Acidobacteriota bacterium]